MAQISPPRERLVLPLLFCLAGAVCCSLARNQVDPDLWGHVRYGIDALRAGKLQTVDPYSYLTAGRQWTNHEIIAELTMGSLELKFGPAGLLIWKGFMGLCTVGLMMWAHWRRPLQPVTVVLATILVILTLRVGWVVRPQLFTYLLASVLTFLLVQHDRGHVWQLCLVPPLITLWTNAHGGFLAGLCILAVHLSFKIAAGVWSGEWEQVWLPGAILVCSFAATLINPYGLGLLDWLRGSLGRPRPEIAEWQPVELFDFSFMSFKVLLVLTVLSLSFSRLARPWHHVALLGLVAWQALAHCRHVPLFGIMAAYYVPAHLDDFLQRIQLRLVGPELLRPAPCSTQRFYHRVMVLLGACLCVLSVLQYECIRVYRSLYPVSAFQYIADNRLSGRMVTEFNWAQYCIYVFGPGIQVSVDGRFRTVYPQEVLDWNLDFAVGDLPWRYRGNSSGAYDPEMILELGSPNLALVDRRKENGPRTMQQQLDEWVLLYQDSLAQVWGRAEIYDDPSKPSYVAPDRRQVHEAPQTGYVAYPALPRNLAEFQVDQPRVAMINTR